MIEHSDIFNETTYRDGHFPCSMHTLKYVFPLKEPLLTSTVSISILRV